MLWPNFPQPAVQLLAPALIALLCFLVHSQAAHGADDANPPAGGGLAVAPLPEFANDLQVRVDGKSLSLAEAIRLASADRQLALYRQLRSAHSSTADGQLLLAKWCRKQGMTDEARLHWWTLLSMRPDDREAIKALRLRKYQGVLLTQEEIAQVKDQE